MRINVRTSASWIVAMVGAAAATSSTWADFSNVTITAEYVMTDGSGNPISAAGGGTQMATVSHEFNLRDTSQFDNLGMDSTGTIWFEYRGPDVRMGSHLNPGDSPWVRARVDSDGDGFEDQGFRIGIREDPMVVANFNVAAGIMNTNFTITSSLVSGFGTILNGEAIASAAISVTDSATFGDRGFVSLTGLQPGSNAYSARFNNLATPVTFVDLISSGSFSGIPAGSTRVFDGASVGFPLYQSVPGAVTDIQSQFSFTLSRFDRAAGTSTFEIIPAPGAVGLLALGGLIAGRRRRSV